MNKNILILMLAATLAAGGAMAQTLKRVEKADDLPRFSYPMQGEIEAVVRDPQKFAAFAQQRRKDVEGVLATYDIAESAARRALLNELVQLDLLDGKWDDALKRSSEIRALNLGDVHRIDADARVLDQ